ncbi:MAG: aldo/keto reductase [Planctomycetota bacterium]|nr:MAG: aldo/keto reductase [Planctomycetota bacterium]
MVSDRTLGSTGIRLGRIAFGAGPVSQLLVGQGRDVQRETIRRAVELGVDWFDTAATYGGGDSEANLGRILDELDLQSKVRVATKVRILPDQLSDVAGAARRSIEGSLERLRVSRVSLLQIHNSITHRAGDEPTSITPTHVLGPGGLLDEMRRMQSEGLVENLGLTGLGEPSALREVIASGALASIQIPYNLLNSSAGHEVPTGWSLADYGKVIADCQAREMGVFAIRVLAGGALAGRPPSPHTFKTPFFPLELYKQDVARAEQLAKLLPPGMTREEAAVRFSLSHPAITSAIVGFATPEEVAQVVGFAYRGALDAELLERLTEFSLRSQS